MKKIVIFDSAIHLFLISVYGKYIKNNNFEFEYAINPNDLQKYTKDDILVFGLFESNFLLSCNNQVSKKIYLDMEGEVFPMLYKDNYSDYDNLLINNNNIILKWLENKNHYFISQRNSDIQHERSLTGLHYLSLCYYFAKFNLYTTSNIYFPKIINYNYDFITFLGKDKTKKSDRYELLDFILDDLTTCKYNHEALNSINNLYNFNYNFDSYNLFWNILQSFQGKINIIFETIDLKYLIKPNFLKKSFFFSEKTLRALLVPTPSILILSSEIINYLQTLGFKFPYMGFNSYIEIKNYVDYIKKYDIDNWCSENIYYFEENNTLIWNLMYNEEKFIKNIFNG